MEFPINPFFGPPLVTPLKGPNKPPREGSVLHTASAFEYIWPLEGYRADFGKIPVESPVRSAVNSR